MAFGIRTETLNPKLQELVQWRFPGNAKPQLGILSSLSQLQQLLLKYLNLLSPDACVGEFQC